MESTNWVLTGTMIVAVETPVDCRDICTIITFYIKDKIVQILFKVTADFCFLIQLIHLKNSVSQGNDLSIDTKFDVSNHISNFTKK